MMLPWILASNQTERSPKDYISCINQEHTTLEKMLIETSRSTNK